MSDTTPMPTTPAEVRTYLTRMRAALSDLPADDRDELLAGLEADLAEVAAETGDLRAHLGAPETYAAELRSAAGLPERVAQKAAHRVNLRSALSGQWEHTLAWRDRMLAEHPWLEQLRPAWWLLRGLAAAWFLTSMVGGSQNPWFWFIGAALSFWFGRRTRGASGARRTVVSLGNALAALVVLFAVLPAAFSASRDGGSHDNYYYQPINTVGGLAFDGEQVTELYVYDAAGNLVDRARVFDQNGTELVPAQDHPDFVAPTQIDPLPPVEATDPAAPTTPVPSPTDENGPVATSPVTPTTAPIEPVPAPTTGLGQETAPSAEAPTPNATEKATGTPATPPTEKPTSKATD